jgi:hypothetical protein
MTKKYAPILALNAALIAAPHITLADEAHMKPAAPEGHAPIGVMGDHMHKAGEYMVSLRHMNMRMQGNMSGTKKLSDAQVRMQPNEYADLPMMPMMLRVVPQKMDMKMTMLGAMYAPSDKVTLLAMLMQIENEMTLDTYGATTNKRLGSFTTKTAGMGDTIIGALLSGGDTKNGAWHYGLALSVPTGSIEQTDRVLTPMDTQAVRRLPYPMQLGSGSYDVKPSITYNGDWRGWRIGGQANATLRLNDNDEDYRLGDKLELQGWAMKNLRPWASASARLHMSYQGALKGQDSAIILPVPTAQTASSGGAQAALSLGVNLIGQTGLLADHRFALEVSLPVHQNAKGVQMKRQESVTLGWQKAF